MAWTYDPTLTLNRDKIRLLIGDTISTDPQLSDAELDGMLLIYGGTKPTAIAVLRMLAAKYARYSDKWVGDLKILASQKHRAYLAMADALASSGALTPAAPTAGGIRTAQKQATEEDDTLVVPTFKRGITDSVVE